GTAWYHTAMNLPLILHLAGAALVAVLVLLALVARIFGINWYRPLAQSIGFGGAYQLVTGSVLRYLSDGSIGAVCSRFAVYVVVLVAVELMLYSAMSRVSLVGVKNAGGAKEFPAKTVAVSAAVGLASVTAFILASSLTY